MGFLYRFSRQFLALVFPGTLLNQQGSSKVEELLIPPLPPLLFHSFNLNHINLAVYFTNYFPITSPVNRPKKHHVLNRQPASCRTPSTSIYIYIWVNYDNSLAWILRAIYTMANYVSHNQRVWPYMAISHPPHEISLSIPTSILGDPITWPSKSRLQNRWRRAHGTTVAPFQWPWPWPWPAGKLWCHVSGFPKKKHGGYIRDHTGDWWILMDVDACWWILKDIDGYWWIFLYIYIVYHMLILYSSANCNYTYVLTYDDKFLWIQTDTS